jgi:hypothetical protein
MAEKINWNFAAQVLKGPSISGAGSLDQEAYEKIDFTLTNAGDHPIALSSIDKITLLIISADAPGLNITYKRTGSALTDSLTLDGPHFFIGKIAQDVLGASASALTFTNSAATAVEIQILIGRKTA